jgi:hypothetical protein
MTDVTALIDELYADEPATRINSAVAIVNYSQLPQGASCE